MNKRAVLNLSVYSLLHFAIDLTCAWLLLSRVRPQSEIWGIAMLLYNYFAFAMQLPLGILADRINRNSLFASLGCIFVALGCFAGKFELAAAVLAGLGNGLFHVGGGLDTLHRRKEKCTPAGIFVAPGALGLWLGTRWGQNGMIPAVLGIALLVFGIILPFVCKNKDPEGQNAEFALPGKTALPYLSAVFLFSVVVIRGFAGLIFNFEWKPEFALALILAVVLGKVAGGISADLIGSKKTAIFSLFASALCFVFASNPICGILAVFLFNMTMPLTLTAAADAFPGAKGMSFGLMTFGLFLGFLFVYFGFSTESTLLYALFAVLSLVLIVPGLILSERSVKK